MFISIYAIAVFIFGLIIGSFLNVVIYRYNTGLSIKSGRSKCFSCGRWLTVKDLVPVFSFLWYRGKCRTCKARISWQYPFVELLTAFLFLAIYMHTVSISGEVSMSPIFLAIDLIITSIFICIAVYDFKHKIIPDGLVYTTAGLALLKVLLFFMYGQGYVVESGIWSAVIAGPIMAAPFALLWLVSGGRWMGLGDAKLALPIGWLLGLSAGFTAIVFAFWIGTIVILGCMILGIAIEALSTKHNIFGVQLLRGKKGAVLRKLFPHFGLRSEIPFGPFMIIGLYVVYFTAKCLFCLQF